MQMKQCIILLAVLLAALIYACTSFKPSPKKEQAPIENTNDNR